MTALVFLPISLGLYLIVHFLHKFRILHTMRRCQRLKRDFHKPCFIGDFILLLITGLFLSGCLQDVPHDNPLDPARGAVGFDLSGAVQTYYAPHNPVANALVWLEPGNYTGRSAADGSFQINGINEGDYTVFCSAEGYQIDSLRLRISKPVRLTFQLNGLPRFVHHALTTHHVARWFPLEDVYYLEITAQVNDPDGLSDITLLRCEIPYISYSDTLDPGQTAGSFKKNIFAQDLGLSSLQELLGHEAYLIAEDNPGAQVYSPPVYAARVIEKSADLLSPIELESVPADSIHFQWELKGLPYPYELQINIFAINAGIATPVEVIDGISSQLSDWLYRSTLPAGDYFWTITIRDSFGNTSQSKEGVFQIM